MRECFYQRGGELSSCKAMLHPIGFGRRAEKMKRLRTAAAAVVLVAFAAGLVVFWGAPRAGLPDLLPAEELQLTRTLAACRAGRLDEISYGHTEAVVGIGGRAVPHVVAELTRWRARRPEAKSASGAVLVDILWRLARGLSPDDPWRATALDGICACLRPAYRSATTARDRKVAAAALVVLGAVERLPALRRLIEELQGARARAAGNRSSDEALAYLERAASALEAGRRVASPQSLCWLPAQDRGWRLGFCDPLGPPAARGGAHRP